jgi:hypothetical protein
MSGLACPMCEHEPSSHLEEIAAVGDLLRVRETALGKLEIKAQISIVFEHTFSD